VSLTPWAKPLLALALPFGFGVVQTSLGSAAEQKQMYFGTCDLPQDPYSNRDELWWISCATGRAGYETNFAIGDPDLNGRVKHANGYLGLHVSRYLSLHGKGMIRESIPDDHTLQANKDARPELGVIGLGSPAFHKMRLLAGFTSLPFGVDESNVVESYQLTEDRSFWGQPTHGAVFTYDNLRDLLFEIGAGSNEWRKDDAVRLPRTRAIASRLMFDIPALDGTRLLFSGQWQDTGQRRFGFGFVTVSTRSDLTQFEFVRFMPRPTLSAAPARQLFRVGYESAFKDSTRWVVQYDDQWRETRSFIIGRDIRFFEHLEMRLAGWYRRVFTGAEEARQWYLTAGLEARL